MKTIALYCFSMVALGLVTTGCNNTTEAAAKKEIVTSRDFGHVNDVPVKLYTLSNKNGVTATITNYGGTLTSWNVPAKDGKKVNIVLGFDSITGYLAKPPYFGATIGRYGNRIGDGKFKLGDSTYTLAKNNGKNALHGGLVGFDKVVWEATPSDSLSQLTLHYKSRDGEEGYPGNLDVTVVYTLTDADELQIEYSATTDKPTPVNLTNHSYFNLTGDVANTILAEKLQINADNYTPVDSTLIPTGVIAPVKGTPFDFTSPMVIGARIGQVPGGYDHNFVLNSKDGGLQLAAVLSDSSAGRSLEVYTTEPGLQFYTGNFLNGSIQTPGGKPINKNAALCLETQHFPDSPNKNNFPSTILKPGDKYHTVTKYKIVTK